MSYDLKVEITVSSETLAAFDKIIKADDIPEEVAALLPDGPVTAPVLMGVVLKIMGDELSQLDGM